MFRVAAFILLRKCFKNVDLIPACMSIHVCMDAYTREHGGQRARSEAITHAPLVFKTVTGLKHLSSDRLAGQQTPRVCLSPLPLY